MKVRAMSVESYLEALPADRRAELEKVRKVILEHLPKGYVEVLDFGMPSYVIPLSLYPDTYNGHPLPIAGLAMQKNHLSLYLMGVYGDAPTQQWFAKAWKASGKKLDMGKSCVRFQKADDLALDVIAKTIERVTVERYLKAYEESRRARPAAKKAAAGARRAPPARTRRA